MPCFVISWSCCRDGTARLIKMLEGATVLAEAPFAWTFGSSYELSLQLTGTRIQAWIDGDALFDLDDADRPLGDGAIALIATEGRLSVDAVTVRPAS